MTSLLRFDHVALIRGGRLLFEELSFRLDAGETIQVLGSNGVGKSSLIRLAAGLLRQSAGTVERTSSALADDRLALDRELPLRRALQFWGEDVEAAMESLGIGRLADVPVRLLSTGQLKRAMLARVTFSKSRVWLLDEPLTGLDRDGEARLGRMISDHLSRGGAVLAASHQNLPGQWRALELGR